jgi:uncharacterized surface protein with fasciclin (FAS1) repeats
MNGVLALALALTMATAPAPAQPFGTGCLAMVTDTSLPVTQAAEGHPDLSTFVDAVNAAAMAPMLDNAGDITVFAPANEAFDRLGLDNLEALMSDEATLANILNYHVVPYQIPPQNLPGEHSTWQGTPLTATGDYPSFKVNGTGVLCGDLPSRNATIYVIDDLLMPPA